MATDKPWPECGVVGREVGVHVGGLCVASKQAVPAVIALVATRVRANAAVLSTSASTSNLLVLSSTATWIPIAIYQPQDQLH